VYRTDIIAYHKCTLTAGPSCLSATTNYMHVPRPLCYRQHSATDDIHTICGSYCWRYWSVLICCVRYLWRELLVWEQQWYEEICRRFICS